MLKRQRTVLGRVLRDIERKMAALAEDQQQRLRPWLERAQRIAQQRAKDKNKLYALHAPEVECIGKGKARQPYEFGVKVSLAITAKQGLIVFPGQSIRRPHAPWPTGADHYPATRPARIAQASHRHR